MDRGGELHLHLDGSIRISTIIELAPEIGLRLPEDGSKEALRQFLFFKKGMTLSECLEKFYFTVLLLQRKKDLQPTRL